MTPPPTDPAQSVPTLAVAIARVETRLEAVEASLCGLATKTELSALSAQVARMSQWTRWMVQTVLVAILALGGSIAASIFTR